MAAESKFRAAGNVHPRFSYTHSCGLDWMFAELRKLEALESIQPSTAKMQPVERVAVES